MDRDTTTMATTDPLAEEKARRKDYSRESRLSFRNFAEHQLRNELKEAALEKCKPKVGAFAECAKETGLGVIFSCRTEYNEVKECLAIHNSEDAWRRYKADHMEELERRARLSSKD